MGSIGVLVLNHALLDFVIDFSFESSCGWTCLERRHVNRTTFLQLLPILASVSRVTYKFATSTPQYAALRLAAYDIKLAAIKFFCLKKAKFVQ